MATDKQVKDNLDTGPDKGVMVSKNFGELDTEGVKQVKDNLDTGADKGLVKPGDHGYVE